MLRDRSDPMANYRKSLIYEDIPMNRVMLSLSAGRHVVAASLAAVALSTAACSDRATAPASPAEGAGHRENDR